MFDDIIQEKKKIVIKEFPMRTNKIEKGKEDILTRARAIKKLIKHAKSLNW